MPTIHIMQAMLVFGVFCDHHVIITYRYLPLPIVKLWLVLLETHCLVCVADQCKLCWLVKR